MFQKLRSFKHLIPTSLRPRVKGLLSKVGVASFKYDEELNFWRKGFVDGKWTVENYYGGWLLHTIAQEDSQDFLAGKIVADFGCGPMGSLKWATAARLRIGIDVLSDAYSEFDITDHDMVYVVSSEQHIPLPSNFVDVLYTCNSLDHVGNLPAICKELLRIIKPGGIFMGSFNMDEPGTFSEPQTLTEKKLNEMLLDHCVETNRRHGEGEPNRIYYRGTKKAV